MCFLRICALEVKDPEGNLITVEVDASCLDLRSHTETWRGLKDQQVPLTHVFGRGEVGGGDEQARACARSLSLSCWRPSGAGSEDLRETRIVCVHVCVNCMCVCVHACVVCMYKLCVCTCACMCVCVHEVHVCMCV